MDVRRPLRIEVAYGNAISRLLSRWMNIPTISGWNEIQSLMQYYSQSLQALQKVATELASKMVTAVSVQNAMSWREAARKSTKGALIYQMLRQEMAQPHMQNRLQFLIQENAQYISTVPQVVAEHTVHHIQKEQMAGKRSEDIMRDLKPYMQGLKRWQIERIARTEVGKADTAITRTRAEDIGLNWYMWETSQDARVRHSHDHMQDVLVNWNDPPSPEALVREKPVGHYHAGNIYNCRCLALPIVDISDVKWPHKVYAGGNIMRMSLTQFKKIAA